MTHLLDPLLGPVNETTAFSEFQRFCNLAYYPGQRVYFFACWPDRRPEGQRQGPDPDPRRQALPRRLHRKELWYVRDGVREEINVHDGISVTLGGRQFRRTFDKLLDFNHLGFEVFGCMSTLTDRHRASYTVYESRWVTLESDVMSLAAQWKWMATHPQVELAVYSGGKSIHGHIAIAPVQNGDCLYGWRDIRAARKARYRCDNAEYHVAATRIGAWAEAEGMTYDKQVLSDPSRLVRVPGFRHRGGGMARLITREMLSGETAEAQSTPQREGKTTPEGAEGRTSYTLFPYGGAFQPPAPPPVTGQKPAVRPGQWLDDLIGWERLSVEGIRARHTRRSEHYLLFTVSRLRGWSEERMASEWRRVVAINPLNIGCTVAKAVEEVIDHWRADKVQCRHPAFVLPYLPATIADHRQQSLQDALARRGCPDPYSARRIICEVLWACAVSNPRACREGYAIEAARMNRVSRLHDARVARRWLEEQGILRTVSHSYEVGRYFKRYHVSVHLILWLLGYRVEDLQWRYRMERRVQPADRKQALGRQADGADEIFAELAPVAG